MCLIKLFCRPNWPFWCTSFDVRGWERGVETVKPIKETRLLSSQLLGPEANGNIEPNALVLQTTRIHSHMHKHTHIYIYSARSQTKTPHESSRSDLRVGQGYLQKLKTRRDVRVQAKETDGERWKPWDKQQSQTSSHRSRRERLGEQRRENLKGGTHKRQNEEVKWGESEQDKEREGENSLDRARECREMKVEAKTNGANGQGDECVGKVQVL